MPSPLDTLKVDSSGEVEHTGIAVSVGDFNDDGQQDLITADGESSVSMFLAEASHSFGTGVEYIMGDAPVAVDVLDLNQDGFQDVVSVNRGSNDVTVSYGRGDGTIRTAGRIAVGDRPQTIASGDLNNDGWVDIIVGSSSSSLKSRGLSILMGNADGAVSTQRMLTYGEDPFLDPFSANVGDFDGDDFLDLVVADSRQGVFLFQGDGDGTFKPETPLEILNGPLVIGDINGDSFDDLITISRSRDRISLSLGNGDGSFAPESFMTVESPDLLELSDVDNDTRLDLVVNSGQSYSVFLGEGDGSFAASQLNESFPLRQRLETHRGLTITDVNRDGSDDIVTLVSSSSGDSVSLLFGNGDGNFGGESRIPIGDDDPWRIASGDFNDDDDVDLVITNRVADEMSVLLGIGDGTFSEDRRFETGRSPGELIVADINGDGDLDVATANSSSGDVSVLHGDGDGRLLPAGVHISIGQEPSNLVSGDVDGDSILDIVTTNSGSNDISILLGQKDGSLTPELRLGAGQRPSAAVIGDFNSDGVQDIATSNADSDDVSVLLGTESGVFSEQVRFSTGDEPVDIKVGDLNQDGNLDIATANFRSGDVSLLFGSGNGLFLPEHRLSLSGGSLTAIAIEDMNADGILDIVADDAGTCIWLGLGGGTFPNSTCFSISGADMKVADLDGDGTKDLVTAKAVLFGSSLQGGSEAAASPPRIEYDAKFSVPTSQVDELGRKTLYEIDPANGNTLSIKRPGVDGAASTTTKFTYTESGLIDTQEDALGRITDFDYDQLGRLTQITFARGTVDEGIQKFDYDDAGNQILFIDENQNRTDFEYDELNRLRFTREPDSDGAGPMARPVTEFVYDKNGNLHFVIDARGNRTENVYDKRNRLKQSIDADRNVTQFKYDKEGNVTRVIDPLGHTTRKFYDARNRLRYTIDPEDGTTRFRYDADDNLIALTDPVANTTLFRYDARDRLIRETDPRGKETVYLYDAVDNLRRKTDRNGRVTEFQYDDLDRLDVENWLDVAGNVVNSVDYNYDLVGNLKSVVDEFSQLAFEYDFRDRTKQVDNAGTPRAPNVVLDYVYDDVGNVTSISDAIDGVAGATTEYLYDALNRTERISQSGANVAEKRVDFFYNQLGQYERIERYSDLAGDNLVARSDYLYDALNRLDSLTHKNSQATDNVIAFYNLEYDSATRITQIEDIYGTTTYGYDDRSQLVSASREAGVDESFSYDPNGNRQVSHLHDNRYQTETDNRISSDGEYIFAYDDEGNLILRTEIATGKSREFTWDHRNRLTSVTDDSEGDVTQEVAFTYDVFNRRIMKTVDKRTSRPFTKHFVYDRADVLIDLVDSDGTAGPAPIEFDQRYLHGQATDQVLAQDDQQSRVNWHLTDHLGSVTALLGIDGRVVELYRYDSFGQLVSAGAANHSRYMFTGREYDEEIALYYVRARYLDVTVGRFISSDPIRFASGDTNLYRYVRNAPILHSDPSGTVAPAILLGLGFFIEKLFFNPTQLGTPEPSNLALVSELTADRFGGHLLDGGKFICKIARKTPRRVATPTIKSSPFGPKVADAVPKKGVPKHWSGTDIEDAVGSYRASIATRKAEQRAFDLAGSGNATERLAHARRITEEENFLSSLLSALENRR